MDTATAPQSAQTGETPHVSVHKERVSARIDEAAQGLLALSHDLHAHPELSYDEHRSAARVADHLRAAGFDTTVGVYGLDTAVQAVAGTGSLRVVVCAEYDALPGIGHACGHNIIATAGLGAAIGLAAVADELDLTVVLLGTPAEEHGGGKIPLLAAGAWDGAALSLMVHPMGGQDTTCAAFRSQGVDRFKVTYTGRSAHAAAAPHRAVNAADAVVVAQVAIGLLRQQLADGIRLAAFVEHGGEATNIVPGRTVVQAEVRSFDLPTMDETKRRMLACFEAGALATDCTLEVEPTEPRYEDVIQDPALAGLWDANLMATGRELALDSSLTGGSTDMGNVSHVVPSIHPCIAILDSAAAPHTVEFAADAVSPGADQAVLDGAKALAWTVVDAAATPAVRADLIARLAARTELA